MTVEEPSVEAARDPLGDPPLGARALRGSLWTLLRYGVEYVLRFGSSLVLTRLLFPEAFGLMALVNAFMMGLQLFSDLGITASVIQSPRGDRPELLNTAWTLQVLRGALLWSIAGLLSLVIAGVWGQEELRLLIPAAALTVLIRGFDSMSLARLQRQLQLGTLTAIEIGSRVVAVALMIGWALLHPTVWVLVAGGVAGAAVRMSLSHTVLRSHRHRFQWDREAIAQLVGFGKWIFVSTALTFLASQTDRFIFGRLLPLSDLGVYSIALLFATLPTQVLWSIGNLVLFPAFSRRLRSREASQEIYERAQRPVLFLGSLAVAFLAASGPDLIGTLYDPRYAGAGWMLQVLAFGSWLQILQTTSGTALLALGDPRQLALGNALKFAGMLALLPAGFVAFGVGGGIAGFAASELFRYGTFVAGMRKHGLPALRPDLLPSALTLGAALAGLSAPRALGLEEASAAVRLAAAACGVLAVWTPAAALGLRADLARLVTGLRARGTRPR